MRRSAVSVRLCIVLVSLAGVLGAQPSRQTDVQSADATTSKAARSAQPQTPTQGLDRLDAAVGLSSEQKADILPLLQQLQTELATLRSSGASRAAALQGKQAFIATTASQIRALLTGSQQSAFDAMRSTQLSQIFGR